MAVGYATRERRDYERSRITKAVRDTVYMRDGYKCRYCGSGYEIQIDHIHPVSRGGTSDYSNLQVLCRSCNMSKGAKLGYTGDRGMPWGPMLLNAAGNRRNHNSATLIAVVLVGSFYMLFFCASLLVRILAWIAIHLFSISAKLFKVTPWRNKIVTWGILGPVTATAITIVGWWLLSGYFG